MQPLPGSRAGSGLEQARPARPARPARQYHLRMGTRRLETRRADVSRRLVDMKGSLEMSRAYG